MSKNTVASLSQDIAALTATVNALAGIIAARETPAAAPATGKASAAFGGKTFGEYVDARKAAALACVLHDAAACNRTFSPKSSGNAKHEARIV